MTRYAKTNHNAKIFFSFLGIFRIIFVGSIIVAMYIYNIATRFFNVSVYFLRDTLLRVKGLALTASGGSGFLRNLFYLLTSVFGGGTTE